MRHTAVCLFLLLPASVYADELHLKDGTKIVGAIVGFENNSFKVETSYGFALVRKDKVASILISEPSKEAAAAEHNKSLSPAKPAPTAKSEPAATQPATKETLPAPTTTAAQPASPLPVEPPMREEVAGSYYINHTYGFQIYKPPSWHVIEGAQKMLANAIVAMGTSDETTLLVVGREPLHGSLEAHVADAEAQLHEIYTNYRALGGAHSTIAGLPAVERRFRGSVDGHDWSGRITSLVRGNKIFTILGMTYADSDLIQIQENVIAKTIASLEFIKQ